jgi:hypothetical protein
MLIIYVRLTMQLYRCYIHDIGYMGYESYVGIIVIWLCRLYGV